MEDVGYSYTYLSETATLRVKEKLNMNKKSGNEVSEIGTSIHRQNKQKTIRNKPTRIHIYVQETAFHWQNYPNKKHLNMANKRCGKNETTTHRQYDCTNTLNKMAIQKNKKRCIVYYLKKIKTKNDVLGNQMMNFSIGRKIIFAEQSKIMKRHPLPRFLNKSIQLYIYTLNYICFQVYMIRLFSTHQKFTRYPKLR